MLLVSATRGQAAELGWTDVTVRLYHSGVVSKADETRALATAAGILAAADVTVRWTLCHASAPVDPACARPLAPGERALRLTRVARPPAQAPAVALGEALLPQGGQAPVFAMVYVERVELLAQHSGADTAIVLGRAMAHELTHLLTGNGRHAPAGLMRPVWSVQELTHDHAADWALDSANLAAIRAHVPAPMTMARR